MFGADLVQDVGLFRAAHHVDQVDAVLEADLVEHLAEVRRGGGVTPVPCDFCVLWIGHAERRQRIDAMDVLLGRRCSSGMFHDVEHLDGAMGAYIAPPMIATVLPVSALAASEVRPQPPHRRPLLPTAS